VRIELSFKISSLTFPSDLSRATNLSLNAHRDSIFTSANIWNVSFDDVLLDNANTIQIGISFFVFILLFSFFFFLFPQRLIAVTRALLVALSSPIYSAKFPSEFNKRQRQLPRNCKIRVTQFLSFRPLLLHLSTMIFVAPSINVSQS